MECLRLIQDLEFFSKKESKEMLDGLIRECSFSQKEILIYGRKVLQPRLIAYQGDPNAIYSYSNQTLIPDNWTPISKIIREKISELIDIEFNSVLINFYRDGKDSMGMHSDNEPELGKNPLIASVSFGANRSIVFKSKKAMEIQAFSLPQPSGCLLIMAGKTQEYWLHGISKSKIKEPRLNLTFRKIVV
jgi:alkylated DNA repair dioxygenase AlkB